VKTFHKESSQQKWEDEVNALVMLRSALNSNRRGVIRFLGSFTHGATFNIILEHANGGTLENYFQTFPPPSLSRDIHHFWESLLRLISVLTFLQNLRFYDNSVYQGYVTDVEVTP
jgi:hypothetical protein